MSGDSRRSRRQASGATIGGPCSHWPMGRQDEALRVAEELLADIELKRMKASDIVLKASRLARLVGHDDLTTFVALERNGYEGGTHDEKWIERAGRWSNKEKDKFYALSIARSRRPWRLTRRRSAPCRAAATTPANGPSSRPATTTCASQSRPAALRRCPASAARS